MVSFPSVTYITKHCSICAAFLLLLRQAFVWWQWRLVLWRGFDFALCCGAGNKAGLFCHFIININKTFCILFCVPVPAASRHALCLARSIPPLPAAYMAFCLYTFAACLPALLLCSGVTHFYFAFLPRWLWRGLCGDILHFAFDITFTHACALPRGVYCDNTRISFCFRTHMATRTFVLPMPFTAAPGGNPPPHQQGGRTADGGNWKMAIWERQQQWLNRLNLLIILLLLYLKNNREQGNIRQ